MTSMDPGIQTRSQVDQLLASADEEVREVITHVLRVERDNLHMSRPQVRKEILEIIERIVQ